MDKIGLAKKPYTFRLPEYDAPTHCASVVSLGKTGKNLAQIATNIGIPRSLLFKWATTNPEFKYALELSQEYALAFWSDIAENALFDPAFRSDVFSKMMGIMFPRDVAGGGGMPDIAEPEASNTDSQAELARTLARRGISVVAGQKLNS